MKVLVAICSKGRPERLAKSALPFVKSLGLPYKVFVEPQDRAKYNGVTKHLQVIPENDKGLGYALNQASEYAKEQGYGALFKVDDDVTGLKNKEGADFKADLDRVIQALGKFKSVGAICFPYDFEFYAITPNKLFTRVNKRIQTCYIIKLEAASYRSDVSTFEDFWQFFSMRNKGYDTLYCSKYGIACAPVGGGSGGLQDFDRSEMAKREIVLFKSIDPSIEVISKPDKPWKFEPKMVGKKYKSRKI